MVSGLSGNGAAGMGQRPRWGLLVAPEAGEIYYLTAGEPRGQLAIARERRLGNS
jgi:hypothetical protein